MLKYILRLSDTMNQATLNVNVDAKEKPLKSTNVEPKGMGGRKSADNINNLVALTRECHERAHGPESRLWKERFKQIIERRETTP